MNDNVSIVYAISDKRNIYISWPSSSTICQKSISNFKKQHVFVEVNDILVDIDVAGI